ncbi:MAG TPA: response regulator [Candidatus Angelobacter sp.]|nr:response regulator [Candidatus Angelobacter sp.]
MSTFPFRILFVDDEPSVRTTSAAVLEASGYEVLTAADGLEGLHALDEAQPDLIISDLRMPRMSGFEFLAVVRNRFPQIPTIAVSGEYVTDNIPEGLLADTFFQKGDYSVADLLNKVKELVRKAPERPVQGKRNFSPIWIALNGSGEIIVTCPKCLRSFDVDKSQVTSGTHKASCPSCSNTFTFNIDQFSMPQFFGAGDGAVPPSKAKRSVAKRRSARG